MGLHLLQRTFRSLFSRCWGGGGLLFVLTLWAWYSSFHSLLNRTHETCLTEYDADWQLPIKQFTESIVMLFVVRDLKWNNHSSVGSRISSRLSAIFKIMTWPFKNTLCLNDLNGMLALLSILVSWSLERQLSPQDTARARRFPSQVKVYDNISTYCTLGFTEQKKQEKWTHVFHLVHWTAWTLFILVWGSFTRALIRYMVRCLDVSVGWSFKLACLAWMLFIIPI